MEKQWNEQEPTSPSTYRYCRLFRLWCACFSSGWIAISASIFCVAFDLFHVLFSSPFGKYNQRQRRREKEAKIIIKRLSSSSSSSYSVLAFYLNKCSIELNNCVFNSHSIYYTCKRTYRMRYPPQHSRTSLHRDILFFFHFFSPLYVLMRCLFTAFSVQWSEIRNEFRFGRNYA